MTSSRLRIFSSSVGTKLLIGLTGFFLVLYLLIHIFGNLIIFLGPEAFNRYAYVMEVRNPTLPLLELIILVGFAVHIYKAIRMYLENRQKRPVSYRMKKYAGAPSRKSFASSTMIVSGLWLLAFLIIHVKAFRFSEEYPLAGGGRDLYRQEFENLSNPLVVGFYVLSMLVVGSHLWHGIASSLQSLGFDHPVWTPRVLVAAKVLAVAVAGGFVIIALWVHFTGVHPGHTGL
jgi:succinate dehydrogenase / fumarate reductase cytochrome b subunit